MSKMVSARIPDALFEQASMQLDLLGANTSDLVNAAFEYVLREKKLPGTTEQKRHSHKRTLTSSQKDRLTSLFRDCTLGVDMSDDTTEDKRVAREARLAKYESLD